jgi:hypothetical protein
MHMPLWNCVSRPRGLAVSTLFYASSFMWVCGRMEGGSLSVVPRETREGWPLLTVETMDQIAIKTPNHKCRLYWCLIECIDTSQPCWYIWPALWGIDPLTFSLVSSPPSPVWICMLYTQIVQCTVCKGGGGERMGSWEGRVSQTDIHLYW